MAVKLEATARKLPQGRLGRGDLLRDLANFRAQLIAPATKRRAQGETSAIGWLGVPHWLMLAGAVLVVVGLIGLVISRRRRADVQGEPGTEPRSRVPGCHLCRIFDSRP